MSEGEQFVALVGFPRSGTTVLTALLDAHSDVTMYYEPWNASPNQRPEPPESCVEFRALMEARFGSRPRTTRFVGFKETVTYEASREFAVRTIDNVSRETSTHVIWIFRDPIHCFFSKLDGARKWWGRPDACFSEAALVQYLRESGPHLAALLDVTERHGGTIVGYQALVSRPEHTLQKLMQQMGLSLETTQLDYYKTGPQPGRVMGDPDVAERPAPISDAPSARRRAEVEGHRSVIDEVLTASEFAWLRAECSRLASLPGVAAMVRPADELGRATGVMERERSP